jgi:hypothetical protein
LDTSFQRKLESSAFAFQRLEVAGCRLSPTAVRNSLKHLQPYPAHAGIMLWLVIPAQALIPQGYAQIIPDSSGLSPE